MIDVVEQTFNVKFQHPIISPTSGSCDSNGINRRFTRSLSIGVGVKYRFHDRLKDNFTVICAIRSETVGIPNILTPPFFFGISTALTGGGK